MIASDTMNESEWKLMKRGKRERYWFQNETKYAMYDYNLFSNIDYQKQSPKGVLWKGFSCKFRKIHRKTRVSESLF